MPGPDEEVLVGVLRGAAAARVDDDHLAAAVADAAQPTGHVGRRQQAAVRRERVGAQHQQVVGAVDVGHRHAEGRAEHQPGGHLLGHLVDRAGRVDVARAEGLHERAPVEQRVEVVGVRVAEVHGDGVAPVLLEDRPEAAVDLGERLVPRHLVEAGGRADQRRADPVRVLVELLQREPLGQMKPWLKTSSASPRIELIAPSSSVISRPHVASQSGQVR